jgi:hypothetical protein
MSNSHCPASVQFSGSVCFVVIVKLFVLPATQAWPEYPTLTSNDGSLMTGHGVRGIGTKISSATSNSQIGAVLQVAGTWLVVIENAFFLLFVHDISAALPINDVVTSNIV